MLKLIIAPSAEPVTATEVKLHAKIETTADDALITILIAAARQEAEQITGRALINQTWELVLSDFADEMILPFAPISSITSIKYMDAANAEQTLAASVYDLIDEALPPRVVLKYGQVWPSVYAALDAVRIQFVAGYGADSTVVPNAIRSWMLLRITSLYGQRETFIRGGAQAVPTSFVDSLLDPYRIVQFA